MFEIVNKLLILISNYDFDSSRSCCASVTGSAEKFDISSTFPIELMVSHESRDRAGTRMKTYSAKPHEITRDWYVVDASGKVLGRLAAEIAHRLRGKHKPQFTRHIDTGDFIVVVNVDKLRVTGNKAKDKLYHRHSGYPGGLYTTSFEKMQEKFPARVLEKAVKGMLPKGPLGYAMLKKLKAYVGTDHPHVAQQPKTLDF